MTEPPKISVMNPNWIRLGKIYSQALFESITNIDGIPIIAEQLTEISKILLSESDFSKLTTSGALSKDQRVNLIEKVFKDRVCEPVFNLLGVLAENDRLYVFPAIAKAFSKIIAKQANQIEVLVTVACEMSDHQKNQLSKTLENVLKAKPSLKFKIAPEIVGGIKLRVGDAVYDASIAGALDQMRTKIQHQQYAKPRNENSQTINKTPQD